MGIKYEFDQGLQNEVEDISKNLFPHVKLDRIKCFRSYGSSSRNTIARCHALGKLLQMAIGVKGWYAIEFLHENFEKLSQEEKTKVMIHELMHIPKTFGGGFRHHDYVCDKNIDIFHKQYKNIKQGNLQNGDRKLKDLFRW
ncbi:metallopeptidase [Candidatus Pacearchaeota archaeon]|nr:metallopeptidase [Candidatus Pacearchaeota archaeon]